MGDVEINVQIKAKRYKLKQKHGNGVRRMDVGSRKSFAPLTGQNLHDISYYSESQNNSRQCTGLN